MEREIKRGGGSELVQREKKVEGSSLSERRLTDKIRCIRRSGRWFQDFGRRWRKQRWRRRLWRQSVSKREEIEVRSFVLSFFSFRLISKAYQVPFLDDGKAGEGNDHHKERQLEMRIGGRGRSV